MNDPAFYTRSSAEVTAHTQQLAKVQAELDAAYARWEELEGCALVGFVRTNGPHPPRSAPTNDAGQRPAAPSGTVPPLLHAAGG
ncbi:hypothetical protein G6F65_022444 [Rhizopus arrhizus]|nr:hypothetical protein G6F65_022444 [Rhizopus arrhizus]